METDSSVSSSVAVMTPRPPLKSEEYEAAVGISGGTGTGSPAFLELLTDSEHVHICLHLYI